MKPYQQSERQIGPAPQPEVSARTALMSVVLFFALIVCTAFVSVDEPVSCAAPQQVASR